MVCWVREKQEANDTWKRLQEHAETQVKGRLHPVKACLAGSWHEPLSPSLRQEGPVAFGSITGGR